jgi:hypothetical protein
MTGKTQISKALCEALGVPYFKASNEHKTYLKEPKNFVQQLRHADTRLVDFLAQTGASVVMDRAWPCEWVYSQVLDRPTDLEVLRYVDKKFAEINAKVVICVRESFSGWKDDLDPKLNEEMLYRLKDKYLEFRQVTRCESMVLKVDDEDKHREVHNILTWLQEMGLADHITIGRSDRPPATKAPGTGATLHKPPT